MTIRFANVRERYFQVVLKSREKVLSIITDGENSNVFMGSREGIICNNYKENWYNILTSLLAGD